MSALTIKLCGLRTPEDVDAAVAAGADLVGFVLAPSRRRVTPEAAAWLARRLPAHVRSVAVFHHPTDAELHDALTVFRPDLVQVEGRPALPAGVGHIAVLHDGPDFETQLAEVDDPEFVLLDPRGGGGQGRPVDRDRCRLLARHHRLLLAGGLRPDNVAPAIAELAPAGVDVSSGIESRPGRKDPALITAFVHQARAARRPAA